MLAWALVLAEGIGDVLTSWRYCPRLLDGLVVDDRCQSKRAAVKRGKVHAVIFSEVSHFWFIPV